MIAAGSRGHEVFDVGAFRVMIHPDTDLKWINYATPSRRGYSARDVSDVVDQFRRRERLPRLEFVADLWPDLPELIEGSGFQLERKMPLMTCTPSWFLEPLAIGQGTFAETIEELRDAWKIEAAAFEIDAPIDEPRLLRRLQRIREGTSALTIVSLDGVPASSAMLIVEGEVGELAGVSTLVEYRGRGLAGVASALLLTRFFRGGGSLAWLSASDSAAVSAYRKIGFSEIGTQLHYGLAT